MCKSCPCGVIVIWCVIGFFIIVLSFIFALVIFFLVFNPLEPKFNVTDASLTRFDYVPAPNNTLFYSLAVNVTVRNPNRRVGIHFLRFQAISHYRKKRFSLVTLDSVTPFYLGHKNTTVLSLEIRGQQLVVLKEQDVKWYDSETGSGFYTIDVKLGLRVRSMYGKLRTNIRKPKKVDCELKIPLTNTTSNNGTSNKSGFGFRATKCTNVYVLGNPSD